MVGRGPCRGRGARVNGVCCVFVDGEMERKIYTLWRVMACYGEGFVHGNREFVECER